MGPFSSNRRNQIGINRYMMYNEREEMLWKATYRQKTMKN